MASQAIKTHRENAEIFHGDSSARRRSRKCSRSSPSHRVFSPSTTSDKFGYNRAAGFMWVTQKKKREHTFKKIETVSYGTELTAFVEPRKMKKMTGVKVKELLLWLTVTEMYIDDPSSGKITFYTGTGLSASYPMSAFEEG